MKYCEIYTQTKDHKSYFRDVVVAAANEAALGIYSKPFAVQSLIFRHSPIASEFPMHVAPQQQFIVYRSGKVEVTASGGETRQFIAGDVLLVSDTQGEGHITKILETGEALVIAIGK